jgi:glycosyltransferase involved in cell wall biosynthesis
LISIVTVVRNDAENLKSTIKNVLNQNYKYVEFIVIDGDSTDGTVDIIKQYEPNLTYWISEPDLGIADAWNKGLSACSGEIIGILNAGDSFSNEDYLSRIANAFKPRQSTVFYGDTKVVTASGQVVKEVVGRFNPRRIHNGIGFLHPGCFATKTAYNLVGNFNLRYRLAMDCDWIFRCYRANVSFEKIDVTCIMNNDGISHKSNLAAYGEYLQSMKDNGFPSIQIYTSMMYVAFRGLVKSIVSCF